MDWSSLPDVKLKESIPFRDFATKESIDDPTALIGTPTWTLEEGLNLLATFRTEAAYTEGEDRATLFQKSWDHTHKVLQRTLISYELAEKTFLVYADDWAVEPEVPLIAYYNSTVYPDRFIEWAREVSLTVPDEFYGKLMRGQQRHIAHRRIEGGDPLTAKESRELGRLRREKENFELAIKATVRAVRFCIKAGRRVKRGELYDLLSSGDEGITKELFERILPLLPPEFRKTPGAPSTCKIGDPEEPET